MERYTKKLNNLKEQIKAIKPITKMFNDRINSLLINEKSFNNQLDLYEKYKRHELADEIIEDMEENLGNLFGTLNDTTKEILSEILEHYRKYETQLQELKEIGSKYEEELDKDDYKILEKIGSEVDRDIDYILDYKKTLTRKAILTSK